MSSFTDKLTVTDLGKGLWRVEKGFRYYIGEEWSNDFIDVPAGFVTDFFSIPPPIQWLLPKTQNGNQSSVLHDYLCVIQDRPRSEIDRIFLESMKVLGVNRFKRWLIYRGVRLWALFSKDKSLSRYRRNEGNINNTQ